MNQHLGGLENFHGLKGPSLSSNVHDAVNWNQQVMQDNAYSVPFEGKSMHYMGNTRSIGLHNAPGSQNWQSGGAQSYGPPHVYGTTPSGLYGDSLAQGGSHFAQPHQHQRSLGLIPHPHSAQLHVGRYSDNVNILNPSFAQPQLSNAGVILHTGLADGQITDPNFFHAGPQFNETAAAANQVPAHFAGPLPSLSQPFNFNQQPYYGNYNAAVPQLLGGQQMFSSPSPAMPRAFPRHAIQPSSDTTFVGASSYDSGATWNSDTVMAHQVRQGFGQQGVQYSRDHQHQIMQQPVTYQSPNLHQFQPQPNPSLQYRVGQMHYGQGPSSDHYAPHQQSNLWPDRTAGESGQYHVRHAAIHSGNEMAFQASAVDPQAQLYASLYQSDYIGQSENSVSDLRQGETETSQTHRFNQSSETGSYSSSGTSPVELVQVPDGNTGQRLHPGYEQVSQPPQHSNVTAYLEEEGEFDYRDMEDTRHGFAAVLDDTATSLATSHTFEQAHRQEDCASWSNPHGRQLPIQSASTPSTPQGSHTPTETDSEDVHEEGVDGEDIDEKESDEEGADDDPATPPLSSEPPQVMMVPVDQHEKVVQYRVAMGRGWYQCVFAPASDKFRHYPGPPRTR